MSNQQWIKITLRSHERYDSELAHYLRLDTIVSVNGADRSINTIDGKHYAVTIETFNRISSALNLDHVGDYDDGQLFRRWVYLAQYETGRCAKILANCIAADDYRQALSEAL